MESAVESSIPLFSHPLTSALASAGLTLDDINSIILFGGNTRVPLVQSSIRSILGGHEEKLAQNVNTDEAAVLGAAYYGAALSRTFKMKNLNVTERSVYDISLGDEVIFEKGTKLGERKIITLPIPSDNERDEIVLDFAQSTHVINGQSTSITENNQAVSKPILSVTINDIAKSLKNYTSPSPVVQVTLRLDPRGYLSVANAVLSSNATDSSSDGKDGGVAGKLKGLFGSKKDKSESGEDVIGEEDDDVENKLEDVINALKKKDTKKSKIALKFKEKHTGIRPMTGEEKRTTQAR